MACYPIATQYPLVQEQDAFVAKRHRKGPRARRSKVPLSIGLDEAPNLARSQTCPNW
jgi:hypothetical protein